MATKKSMWFLLGFFIISVGLFMSQNILAQSQQTYLPVEEEPRHRTVFQNKNVRIYDVLIPPGDLTLFHTHSFDTITIWINGGKTRNAYPGGEPSEYGENTGDIFFLKAPYTHRLGNPGTTPLRSITVELLASSANPGTPAALDAVPGHIRDLENDRVKVYHLFLDPNQETGLRSRTLPWLRISLTQSKISVQEQGKPPETLETKPGDIRWYEGTTTQSLENIGSRPYEAIEIELKYLSKE